MNVNILVVFISIISGYFFGILIKILNETIPKYLYDEILIKNIFKYNFKNYFIKIPKIEIFLSLSFLINSFVFQDISKMIFLDIFIMFGTLLILIDFKHYLLPDLINIPLIIIGLIINYNGIYSGSFINSIIGAISGYVVLYIIYFTYLKIRKKEGLGLGDLKLVSAIGAWLGYSELLYIVTIAAILGLTYSIILKVMKKSEDGMIPFGPFLIVSAIPLLYIK